MDTRCDAELIEHTLAGDDSAFETLVGRYHTTVLRWIQHSLPDARYEEDLAQEVFIEAYFHLDTLRESAKFRAWLRRIARNVCVSHLRQRRPTVSYEQLVEHHQGRERIEVPDVSTPDIRLLEEEARVELEALLEHLNQEQQELVRLYYFEGLSQRDISETCNLSESAVKHRLHRIRQKLRGVLSHAQGNKA